MPSRWIAAGMAAGALLTLAAPAGATTTTDPGTTTEPPPTTSTTVPTSTAEPTTTQATTTEETTTVETTTPTPTVTVPATSTHTTTTTTIAATTATAPTTSARPGPRTAAATSVTASPLGPSCELVAVAILVPHRLPLLLGPVAAAPTPAAGLSRLRYPANGSIVTGSDVSLTASHCGTSRPAAGHVGLASLSLFDGAVVASRVGLTLSRSSTSDVVGLAVRGARTTASARSRIRLARWGYVVAGPPHPVLTSSEGPMLSALAVHLVQRHAGLPAGTIVLVSVAGGRGVAPRKHRARATHEPLKVTPPLALPHYVFPVVGESAYADTYGAFRSDVPGNWHHGDDIFAPLGTPVVAVCDGTINRVGWEKIGGWRLWVRDSAGDQFYYAHLSGYVPSDLRSNRVRAGEVVGFIGNTGDAFTTLPHLHFEVHPHQLRYLGYDGAVDPTTYLDRWKHLDRVTAPVPVHPPLPTQPAFRRQASFVFRELLAARHLIRHAPPRSADLEGGAPPSAAGRYAASPAPAEAGPQAGAKLLGGSWPDTRVTLLAVLLSLMVIAAVVLVPTPHLQGRRRIGFRPPALLTLLRNRRRS